MDNPKDIDGKDTKDDKKSGTKRNRSGYEYRQMKKVREREESAGSCSKLTDFFKNPIEGQPSMAFTNEENESADEMDASRNNDRQNIVINDKERYSEEETIKVDCEEDKEKKQIDPLKLPQVFEPVPSTSSNHDLATESIHQEAFEDEIDLFKVPSKKDRDFFFS